MTPTDSLQEFIADQLAPLGGVRFRRMFGGHGVYRGDRFFAILYRGQLYFRVNEDTKDEYLAHGMKPFRPNTKQTLNGYYEVPADVIEDSEVLIAWAARAHAAPAAKKKPQRATQRRTAVRSSVPSRR